MLCPICEITEKVNQGLEWAGERDTLEAVLKRHKDGGWAHFPQLECRQATEVHMMFTKRLRMGIRLGIIRCSIRIWKSPRVKVGGRYRMDDGHIVVDSITPITVADITRDLARESGFESVDDLLRIAKHGSGDKVYLIRFHYLPDGAWDTPRSENQSLRNKRSG